jgi:hypothetical protein
MNPKLKEKIEELEEENKEYSSIGETIYSSYKDRNIKLEN